MFSINASLCSAFELVCEVSGLVVCVPAGSAEVVGAVTLSAAVFNSDSGFDDIGQWKSNTWNSKYISSQKQVLRIT